jgi:hypothetical protein
MRAKFDRFGERHVRVPVIGLPGVDDERVEGVPQRDVGRRAVQVGPADHGWQRGAFAPVVGEPDCRADVDVDRLPAGQLLVDRGGDFVHLGRPTEPGFGPLLVLVSAGFGPARVSAEREREEPLTVADRGVDVGSDGHDAPPFTAASNTSAWQS